MLSVEQAFCDSLYLYKNTLLIAICYINNRYYTKEKLMNHFQFFFFLF